MGILDKLRPQSKSTHPDPNIRIEAIHELDPSDLDSLNSLAKDDPDARVRRVAVARIGDAAVLAGRSGIRKPTLKLRPGPTRGCDAVIS